MVNVLLWTPWDIPFPIDTYSAIFNYDMLALPSFNLLLFTNIQWIWNLSWEGSPKLRFIQLCAGLFSSLYCRAWLTAGNTGPYTSPLWITMVGMIFVTICYIFWFWLEVDLYSLKLCIIISLCQRKVEKFLALQFTEFWRCSSSISPGLVQLFMTIGYRSCAPFLWCQKPGDPGE